MFYHLLESVLLEFEQPIQNDVGVCKQMAILILY
jgi:hypothetical protein